MALGRAMAATIIYTVATDGLPFRKELSTPWMAATLVDFYINILAIGVLFGVLGCVMLGTLIYTIATDGSPFRRELFTPWLSATLVDFYINIVALSVWVAYKESSWATATFCIILLICFGSISTCAYVVLQLFHLSSQDPVYLVLFSSTSRAGDGMKALYMHKNLHLARKV